MKKLNLIRNFALMVLFLMLVTSVNKAFAGATTYTWTGATSTEWNLASNWGGTVPTSADNASIPAAPTGGRFPTISNTSGTVACRDLTIFSGATVNMTGGTFNFYHDWKNSGTFNGTGGTVVFAGSATNAATWAVSGATNQFFNVTINSGIDPHFYNTANGLISVAGNWIDNNTGALTVTNSYTVTFNGSGSQTITTSRGANNSFYLLTINKSGGTVSLSNAIKTSNNFSVTSGTFDPGTYLLTIGGTFSSFTGGTIRVGAITFSGNYSKNPSPSDGTTVEYYSGAQTVSNSFQYSNLTLSGSDSKTTTGVTVNGTLSMEGTATASAAITYGTSGKLQYKGSGSQTTIDKEFPASSGPKYLIIDNSNGVTLNLERTIDNDLTIQTGSVFNIDPAASLTVKGTTYNNAGITGLVIKSSSSGTGNFINSTTGVYGTVQRYITGGSNLPQHYISTPVWDAPESQVRNGYWIYYYDETWTDQDLDQGWEANYNPLYAGWGYSLVAQNATRTISFQGVLNSANLQHPVSYTSCLPVANPPSEGWNLVGNPFPCALTLHDASGNGFLDVNSSKLDAGRVAAYFWDDPNGDRNRDYASYGFLGGSWTGTAATGGSQGSANGTIAVGQGFFIKVAQSVTNVNFTSVQKSGNTSSQFFIPRLDPVKKIKLSLSSEDGLYNEIIVGFLKDASSGLDIYDVVKYKANPNIAFYSLLDEMELVIQGLPAIKKQTVVPLGFNINDVTTLKISTVEGDEFDYGGIYLQDRLLNRIIDLETTPTYVFTTSTGTINDRFFLFCTKDKKDKNDKKGITAIDEENPFRVYASGKTVHVLIPDGQLNGNIMVYNLLGKQVYSENNVSFSNDYTFDLNGDSGYYLVTITTEKGTQTLKVLVP